MDLSALITIHNEVISTLSLTHKRYLFSHIHWESQAICIVGSRGVGKTTLMCQALISQYGSVEKALYISADNIHVLTMGLFAIAQEYFKYGGEALFIDEVHKYPDWSREIKNIIDTYKNKKIIFSSSSVLALKRSKYDLSRRVVYYELYGLSFREYLAFAHDIILQPHTFTEILKNHLHLASALKDLTILKHFKDYLTYGYYPFFIEGTATYSQKVNNIMEKVLYEDIAVTYSLRPETVAVLKKILWLVTTANGLSPVIDNISKDIGVSREIVYHAFSQLEDAGLIKNIYPDATGHKLIRKPGKVYMDNPNLLLITQGTLIIQSNIGVIRETFFVNQVGSVHGIRLHDHGDFIIDNDIVIEVGGQGKNFKQIKNEKNAYLAVDGLEVGFGQKIPLYLFGFLY
ncbi:MAG: AAA family ATPase [Gammaproteobacteria bacterium]|jgi:predicted AAA+ superfamily ATPase